MAYLLEASSLLNSDVYEMGSGAGHALMNEIIKGVIITYARLPMQASVNHMYMKMVCLQTFPQRFCKVYNLPLTASDLSKKRQRTRRQLFTAILAP